MNPVMNDRRHHIHRTFLLCGLLACLTACSWTHHFTVENASETPITVRYKLDGAGFFEFFADSAVVHEGEKHSVHRIDPADSTIAFTLPPGARAELSRTMNTSYRYIAENPGNGRYRDNLVWMRITTATGEQFHERPGLMQAVTTGKNGMTVIRIGE